MSTINWGIIGLGNIAYKFASAFDELKNEFIHIIDPKPRLFIIGAVHIAQALVSLAEVADYEMILIDPRDHFATKDRFPNCKIINEWPDEALSKFHLDRSSHLVTLTHDPKIDDLALIYFMKKNFGYVGSLGIIVGLNLTLDWSLCT